jgi:hypothetical protein
MAWSPTYATAEDLGEWLPEADPVADAAELALAIEAASRAVDRSANRQFGLVAAPEARQYTAEFDRHAHRWIIEIDDVQTLTGLTVELDNDADGVTEATVTAYQLTPVNASSNGRPFTRIEILPGAPVKPNGSRFGVKVTARWGWSSVPEPIKLATMIQAARLLARRESSTGPMESMKVDDVSYAWRAADLDADVAASVAPFRRVWGAA